LKLSRHQAASNCPYQSKKDQRDMTDGAKAGRVVPAPCSTCLGETRQSVLFEASQSEELVDEQYAMLECCGCRRVSMGYKRIWLYDGTADTDFYPAPISRRQPRWVLDLVVGFFGKDKEAIGGLLSEVYQAVANGQRRLAAMGIRAALEQVMIATIGDLRTFDDKLDAFQTAGYISLVQRDAMRATLNVGDAAMHRGHLPEDQDLELALDIVEGVFAPIFVHKDQAQKLSDAVPPRKRPQP
jgi:hypothetical protein